jgi:hypothetical protein
MKKRMVLLTALSLFAVTALSSWEGAAARAPEGELPAVGFYVATNSFPKNTVVDVTCLETNRTTRAIVANGLDNPGLLAIISREAAELIGIRPGSISTIRMSQPTEPIAYMRFAEGAASGTPYYSSGDVITGELYREDTYKPPVQAKEAPVNGITGPSYVLEPEWRTRGAAPYSPGTPADNNVSSVPEEKIEKPPLNITEPVPEEKVEEKPEYITEPVPEEKVEERPEYITEPVPEEKVEERPEYITEPVPEEKVEERPEYITEPVPEEKVEEKPEYIVEPVPEEKVEEKPEYITEPIPEEKVEEKPEYVTEPVPEEKKEPEKITEVPPPARDFTLKPAEERPPEDTIYGIDPAYIIPGIITAPPAKEPEEPVLFPVIDNTFSVPSITTLDRGWYYVQIASYDKPEAVENALGQIDRRYRPVVYKANDTTYRILLGPLNQGESAAILQRFKSIGYKDAFIRHEK